MKILEVLGWKNGHKETPPEEKKKVEDRLNEVERRITDIHDQRAVGRM